MICGLNHAGREVTLMGWAHRRRDHGGIIFVDFGTGQASSRWFSTRKSDRQSHAEAHRIRSEFVLAVKGTVRMRPEGMENPGAEDGLYRSNG